MSFEDSGMESVECLPGEEHLDEKHQQRGGRMKETGAGKIHLGLKASKQRISLPSEKE